MNNNLLLNMYIFAHRGLKKEEPENTLEAFQAASQNGFGIELDIRLTQDGDLVCIHDSNPERVAGSSSVKNIREATVVEIQKLNGAKVFYPHHAPAKIPRFEDVVKEVIAKFSPSQRAAIHVKHEEQGEMQLQMLLDLFKQYGLHEQAIIFDLTVENSRKIKTEDPAIKTFLSVGEAKFSPTIYLWDEVKDLGDEAYDGVWWDEWKTSGSEYTAERAGEIRAAGKLNYVISPELHADHGHPQTGSPEQVWRKLVAWGVDGVCTAYPRQFEELKRDMMDEFRTRNK